MVHAGIHPEWDLELAKECALELGRLARPSCPPDFLEQMPNWNKPRIWKIQVLQGMKRLCFISNCFTRDASATTQKRTGCTSMSELKVHKRRTCPWYEVPGRSP